MHELTYGACGFTAGKAETRAAAAEELVEQLRQGTSEQPYGNGTASSAHEMDRGADLRYHENNADAGAVIIDIGAGIGFPGDTELSDCDVLLQEKGHSRVDVLATLVIF